MKNELEKGLGRYTAVFTLAEEGGWLVHAKELPRCRTEGDSIQEARANLREALGLFYTDAAKADMDDAFVLPKSVETALVAAKKTRQKAAKLAEIASAATSELVLRLRKDMGLSTRDAAAIAGQVPLRRPAPARRHTHRNKASGA